ncbi:hypothetical protein N0V90_007739 [Kalmusia sp. IMI 367209]|nr:hypothetical protein N0V90_007739 [Kalmusia sp. IMI 367209]
MLKRKAKELPSPKDRAENDDQQKRRKTDLIFTWDKKEWVPARRFKANVIELKDNAKSKVFIVKKTLKAFKGTDGLKPPREVILLNGVPDCNRFVKPIDIIASEAHAEYTLIFESYKLGDLSDWRNAQFEMQGCKEIPEAFLWRFLAHMTQALAVLQNIAGPYPDERSAILHRDIKPDNILVTKNGTSFPSFKLHDFGCSSEYDAELVNQDVWGGTYAWSPPEHPFVHSLAAEVWCMGACLHYIAFGEFMYQENDVDFLGKLSAKDRALAMKFRYKYKSDQEWYKAWAPRLVTPINMGYSSRTKFPVNRELKESSYKPRYSDDINMWMMECLNPHPSERPSLETLVKEMIPNARMMLQKLGGRSALVDMELELVD